MSNIKAIHFTVLPPEEPRLELFSTLLKDFSEANKKRAQEGFKTFDNVPVTYWTTALAGELGELCNLIKKAERVKYGGIDAGSTTTAADITPEKLQEEIGGIFIYLDLLASYLGFSLEDCLLKTFNEKSEKYGFVQRLYEYKESNEEYPDID